MVDSTGTTTWAYNAASELIELDTPQGTIEYTYDDAGRPETMAQTGVGTTTYDFDDAGRLVSLENPFSETTTFAYDAASRVLQKTFHSGTYEVFSYDLRSRPTSIVLKDSLNAVLRSTSYDYDEVSNVIERSDDTVTTEFSYDDIDQLLSETRTGYAASYTYDANGNRLTRTVNSVTEDYSYDDADKLLDVKIGTNVVKEFGYDAAGRTTSIMTSAGTRTLNWDYEDRLTGITYPNTSTNSFAYNGFGTRVAKTDSGGSSAFMRNGVGVTAPVLTDGSAVYTSDISERRSNIATYYHGDIKNGTTQVNSSESISGTMQHDAFGNVTSSSGTWNGPFAYGGTLGYQSDPDSGLMLLGHRYYDSGTSRFLTRDKAKDGRNWYVYCESNPLKRADADGQSFQVLLAGSAIQGAEGFGVGILVGDHLYQRGNDTIRWIAPGGGRTGSRIIHFDHAHGNIDFPHLNSDLYKPINHTRIPPGLKNLATPRNLRFLGKVTLFGSLAFDVVDIATATPEERPSAIGGAVGGLGGALAGAAIGSAILPGVGTIIGGIVGGIGGYLAGRGAANHLRSR